MDLENRLASLTSWDFVKDLKNAYHTNPESVKELVGTLLPTFLNGLEKSTQVSEILKTPVRGGGVAGSRWTWKQVLMLFIIIYLSTGLVIALGVSIKRWWKNYKDEERYKKALMQRPIISEHSEFYNFKKHSSPYVSSNFV